MEEQKKKSWIKLLLKVALTILALYLVFSRIDIEATFKAIKSANPFWLSIAVVFFVLSKAVSALRLNTFFRVIGVHLGQVQNIRLYLIGMFYNLFLPGGIGGDAYKVYLLKRNYGTNLKHLISATLVDRLSGLNALLILSLILALNSSLGNTFSGTSYFYFAISLLVLAYPGFYILQKLFFSYLLKAFHVTNALSLGVQILQLVCAWFILQSLGVMNHSIDYLTLFLVSSVVAVVPFTIGGIGARELVFVFAYEYFLIDRDIAIAFSLLFFLINALVSLSGGMIKENFDKESV